MENRRQRKFKVDFEGTIKRLNVTPTSFEELHQAVRLAYDGDLPERYAFKYRDEDGDLVTVSSENDFHAMLDTNIDPIRIEVISGSDISRMERSSFLSNPPNTNIPQAAPKPEVQPSVGQPDIKDTEKINLDKEAEQKPVEKPPVQLILKDTEKINIDNRANGINPTEKFINLDQDNKVDEKQQPKVEKKPQPKVEEKPEPKVEEKAPPKEEEVFILPMPPQLPPAPQNPVPPQPNLAQRLEEVTNMLATHSRLINGLKYELNYGRGLSYLRLREIREKIAEMKLEKKSMKEQQRSLEKEYDRMVIIAEAKRLLSSVDNNYSEQSAKHESEVNRYAEMFPHIPRNKISSLLYLNDNQDQESIINMLLGLQTLSP
eukprot:TRINITY_DN3337_c0_g3_i1.p1 TRINITY_DN3337_c0_g3~~TRINITY_DN3337_c0_g3_i1.p1  ORF type:complete len:374 (-),score=133.95 TRINITY_DN3337_c0_g3_i1:157-1278(-)